MESGEEIPDELKESIRALGKTVSEVLQPSLSEAVQHILSAARQVLDSYRPTLKVSQIRAFEEIRDEAKAIVEVPEEERWFTWTRAVVEGQGRIISLLEKVLGEQIQARDQERSRERLILSVTIGIAVIGWLIAIGLAVI